MEKHKIAKDSDKGEAVSPNLKQQLMISAIFSIPKAKMDYSFLSRRTSTDLKKEYEKTTQDGYLYRNREPETQNTL